jgi:hypothetical protein
MNAAALPVFAAVILRMSHVRNVQAARTTPVHPPGSVIGGATLAVVAPASANATSVKLSADTQTITNQTSVLFMRPIVPHGGACVYIMHIARGILCTRRLRYLHMLAR